MLRDEPLSEDSEADWTRSQDLVHFGNLSVYLAYVDGCEMHRRARTGAHHIGQYDLALFQPWS